MERESESRNVAIVVLIIAALVTVFWWPTLFERKMLLHGDAMEHGLPLMYLHARTAR
jgi:hypothetical protein